MTTKTTTKPVPATGDKTAHTPELDRTLATVKASVKVYDRKMTARDKATASALDAKVRACRDIITLMTFKETFAARGPKAGKPSVTIIAELLGYPRQSFTPLFKGAEALRDYYATLPEADVTKIMAGATPTERETDLASVGLVSEAERSRANRLKGKAETAGRTAEKSAGTAEGEGEGEGGTAAPVKVETVIPTYDAVVSATLELQNIIKGYCSEGGFSAVQAENLQATLAEMSALIESHRVDGGDV